VLVVVLSLTLGLRSQTPATTHEAEVVRATYATLSFLCGLEPLASAAMEHDQDSINEKTVERQMTEAAPVFEITHMQTGTIASIASHNWGSMVSVPDKNLPAVLVGSVMQQYYSDPDTPQAQWRVMRVHWDIDNSYPPERMAAIQSVTVGQAVAKSSNDWTTPAKYSRYATFQVTATYQGRTVGPYTASFFFGKDAQGNEVVVPQDAIVSGQLLWEAVRQTAYPGDLLSAPRLRQRPVLDHWIQANRSASCSAARADLCCAGGRCRLPESSVARDLARH